MKQTSKSLVVALAAILCLSLVLTRLPAITRAQTGPRNVIVLIGDGMGPEHVKAAGMYQNGDAGTLAFEQLPYSGYMTTYSANSSVTDSAAAASAMATGFKVNNNVISMAYPGDGRELETALEFFQDRCKSTGLVTGATIVHATPAGWGAHEPSRYNYPQIADDYLYQTRPNLILGSGGDGMTPAEAAAQGYTVVTDRAEMQALSTETETMVSGQFSTGGYDYEWDYYTGHSNFFDTYPHLSEMTETALDILDNDPDGFFLMVEEALIDWAAHDNQLEETVYETLELDNTFQVIWEWAQGRDDTLIIVTADHETGGLTVLENKGQGNFPSVHWSTDDHTGTNVPVYAWGPNADMVAGTIDNTDIYDISVANADYPLCGPTPTATLPPTNTPTPPPDGILDLRISAQSDDAEERLSNGSMYLDSSDLELVDDSDYLGMQTVGLRFPGVAVPQGATILSAYLEFTVDETDSVATSLIFEGQAADYAPTFSMADHDISSRATTTASTLWDVPAWNSVGQVHQTPDLAAVVQEIVDRPGWYLGSAMAFVVTGSGERTAEAYDGVPSAAPLLHIEFDPAPTPTPTNTATPGPSPTPTDTPIPTDTPLPTATFTPSPTPSPTPIPPTCDVLEPGKNLGFDTYLNQDKPDDRKGDNSEMRVKTEASKLQRPLMRFDLSSIPPTANVQSMTLSLWVKGLNGPAVDVHAHQVLESWNELEATWNDRDRDAGVPWAEAGGTYDPEVVDTETISAEDLFVEWDLTSLAGEWLGGENHGVILEAPASDPKSEVKFPSNDDGDAGERPRLEVCYYVGPPPTATPTPTNTPVPPTPTNTPVPPTPTNTPIPPTPTNTPIPPTPTNTPIPPTPTNTSLPPTPSNTPTNTPVPPTPTNTPIPPTPTNTPSVPECVLLEPGKNLGFDAYLKEDKADDRKGGDSEMRVKTEAGKLQRPLTRFDLSAVPGDATVASVTLWLWVKDLNGPAVDVYAHEVLESWHEPEVSWNDRDKDAGIPWAVAGGTYDPLVVGTEMVDAEKIWASWDLTSLGAGWLAGENHGVILEAPVSDPKTEVKFVSNDDGDPDERPRLEFCYWP